MKILSCSRLIFHAKGISFFIERTLREIWVRESIKKKKRKKEREKEKSITLIGERKVMGNWYYENGVGRTSKLLHQEEAFYSPLAKVRVNYTIVNYTACKGKKNRKCL